MSVDGGVDREAGSPCSPRAIAAVILLFATKLLIVDRVLDIGTSPLQASGDKTISMNVLAVVLIAAGAIMGALGSGITLRRFLRV